MSNALPISHTADVCHTELVVDSKPPRHMHAQTGGQPENIMPLAPSIAQTTDA